MAPTRSTASPDSSNTDRTYRYQTFPPGSHIGRGMRQQRFGARKGRTVAGALCRALLNDNPGVRRCLMNVVTRLLKSCCRGGWMAYFGGGRNHMKVQAEREASQRYERQRIGEVLRGGVCAAGVRVHHGILQQPAHLQSSHSLSPCTIPVSLPSGEGGTYDGTERSRVRRQLQCTHLHPADRPVSEAVNQRKGEGWPRVTSQRWDAPVAPGPPWQ